MNNNFKQISKILAQRAEEVARFLLPKGKREGQEWCIGSIDGDEGKSLKIRLIGEKAGVWSDFATGDSGDLLDLWSLNRKIKLKAALSEAQEYLGEGRPQFEAYRPKKYNRPPIQKATSLNSDSPVMKYLLDERKLSTETINTFKMGAQGRKIVFPYWREGELILVKYLSLDRPDGKKQIHIEPHCEPCLFGWQALPPATRKITLTEGEFDTASLNQYGIASLSLPFGGGTGKKHEWLEYEFDNLAIFDEIFLCLDNDKEGKAAATELVERLGRYRCRIVKLPYKDANECLQRGVSREEMHKCFDNACCLDPEELRPASAYVEQVINEFYPPNGCEIGIIPPWEKARGKILFRPDELSIWCGVNGHGKSQFLGNITLSAMKQGTRVCIASLEIKPKKILMRLTRQAGAINNPSEGYIRAIHDWYSDKLWVFDLVGTAKADRLLEVFLYARQRYGIEVFVIDSFMKCGIDEDDFKAQKAFIERICDFKNQHNCQVHIVVHPRKSIDETHLPGKMDCKGTSAITDLADNCFTVWRNKKKEEIAQMKENGVALSFDQLEKLKECDCIWVCDKNRNGEWEGKIALWFDAKSFQYLNHQGHRPINYVEYSILNK